MISDLSIYEINRYATKNKEKANTLEYWASARKASNILSQFTPEQLLEAANNRNSLKPKKTVVEVNLDFKQMFPDTQNLPLESESEFKGNDSNHYVIEAENGRRVVKHIVKDPLFSQFEEIASSIKTSMNIQSQKDLYEIMASNNGTIPETAKSVKWTSNDDSMLSGLLITFDWEEMKARADFLELAQK